MKICKFNKEDYLYHRLICSSPKEVTEKYVNCTSDLLEELENHEPIGTAEEQALVIFCENVCERGEKFLKITKFYKDIAKQEVIILPIRGGLL